MPRVVDGRAAAVPGHLLAARVDGHEGLLLAGERVVDLERGERDAGGRCGRAGPGRLFAARGGGHAGGGVIAAEGGPGGVERGPGGVEGGPEGLEGPEGGPEGLQEGSRAAGEGEGEGGCGAGHPRAGGGRGEGRGSNPRARCNQTVSQARLAARDIAHPQQSRVRVPNWRRASGYVRIAESELFICLFTGIRGAWSRQSRQIAAGVRSCITISNTDRRPPLHYHRLPTPDSATPRLPPSYPPLTPRSPAMRETGNLHVDPASTSCLVARELPPIAALFVITFDIKAGCVRQPPPPRIGVQLTIVPRQIHHLLEKDCAGR